MRRTFTVGNECGELSHGQSPARRGTGFTFIELLVALTILVALTAVLAPVLVPSPERILREAASEIATTLRETRRQAQAKQVRQRFLMDTGAGRFGIVDSARRRSLPDDMSVQMTTAESLLAGEDVGSIDFFADGSSTGGRVRLGLEEHLIQVDIEWLTGRIRVSDGTK